jgi:hypothetical protein
VPRTYSETSPDVGLDDLFPEIGAGKELINLIRNPPPWLQSLPTQTADFLFGPEWAKERKAAEATPGWSGQRMMFGAKTVAPFLMFGGKPGEGPGGFKVRPEPPPRGPYDEGPVGQAVSKFLNKFWGNEPWFNKADESSLSPETKALLDKIRNYDPYAQKPYDPNSASRV